MFADMVADMVANMVADMVAGMVADMVATARVAKHGRNCTRQKCSLCHQYVIFAPCTPLKCDTYLA